MLWNLSKRRVMYLVRIKSIERLLIRASDRCFLAPWPNQRPFLLAGKLAMFASSVRCTGNQERDLLSSVPAVDLEIAIECEDQAFRI